MKFIQAFFIVVSFAFEMSAQAFVVQGPRQSTGDAVEDLVRSPRWTMTDGSYLDTGQRGLGGGLEYAIDDSVCSLNFIDSVSCEDIHFAIEQAVERWASGHPVLQFTNVTGKVHPNFPLAVFGDTNQGAEIDFYASTPAQFPNFRNAQMNGYTIFYDRPSAYVSMTNGVRSSLVEGRIESADIRFNSVRCFYLSIENATSQCVHFPTLVFHEVGHAIGLGHPEEKPSLNLDTDEDPYNHMPIDCRQPERGLKVSRQISGSAVLIGHDVQSGGRWERGLTYDDAAGRDALYPHCGIARMERFGYAWGGFARSHDGSIGVSLGQNTKRQAAARALLDCSKTGRSCQFIEAFKGCLAYAQPKRTMKVSHTAQSAEHWGMAVAEDTPRARVNAVLNCNANSGDDSCRVVDTYCAFETKPD